MTTLALIFIGIISFILTAWYVLVPVGVAAASVTAFRRGEQVWKGWWSHLAPR